MHDPQSLTALMYTETDNPPQQRVDIARAVHDGQRRRRRRQVLRTSTVAAVVALALAGGALVVSSRNGAHRPATPANGATAATTTAPPAAPAAFDPLRLHLAADWVPDGLTAFPPLSSTTAQRLTYLKEPAYPANGEPWGSVTVTVYAAGVTPWQLRPRDGYTLPTRTTAPPVLGRTANWLSHETVAGILAWEWAPGAWAVVEGYGPLAGADGAPRDATVLRVAQSVRTDVQRPLLVPFTMATPPTPLRLLRIQSTGVLEFGAAQTSGLPYPIDPTATPGAPAGGVTVSIHKPEPGEFRKVAPDRVIDGHPAGVEIFDQQSGVAVAVYEVDGYTVFVGVSPEAMRYVSVEQAIALAQSVRPLGPPGDESRWTGNPLR